VRNDRFADLVKVGFTNRAVDARLPELNGTGVPGRTIVLYHCTIDDAPQLEALTHQLLRDARDVKGKEFFRVSAATARRVIRAAAVRAGMIIRAEWSSPHLEEEDREASCSRIREQIGARETEYDVQMSRANTVNPFLRGRKIEARSRMRELLTEIKHLNAQLAVLLRSNE
jgi:hypothetical protein